MAQLSLQQAKALEATVPRKKAQWLRLHADAAEREREPDMRRRTSIIT